MKVIIYKDQLLPYSETFIKLQKDFLKNFTSIYLGTRQIDGIEIPESDKIIISRQNSMRILDESLFKLFGFVRQSIWRRIRAFQPDLLHCHFGTTGILGMRIAEQLSIPIIVTFHGFDATTNDNQARKSFPTHRLYLKKRHILIEKQICCIAVSHYIKNRLIKQGFKDDQITVHYTGIDTQKFRYSPYDNNREGVVFVGRMVEQKGGSDLIKALALIELEPRVKRVKFIGDGPARDEWQKLAVSLGVEAEFLGRLSQDEIIEHLSQARVFCVPSKRMEDGREEGLGMVFLEAAAIGTPTVSYNVGGIPEAVLNGRTGLLVESSNINGLAHSIESILKDFDMAHHMSLEGRKHIENHFDIEKQTQKLEEIYEREISIYNTKRK